MEEKNLVEKYKSNYPFSSMLLIALSIILKRDYEQIKDIWLRKVRIFELYYFYFFFQLLFGVFEVYFIFFFLTIIGHFG